MEYLSDEQKVERSEKKSYGLRSPFFRDVTAIIHSQPYRRLKNKTQVFFSPENDHICSRMEHVLYVATISMNLCEKLVEKNHFKRETLINNLAFAIGLGHDLGHAPFGHDGERKLNELLLENNGNGFQHEVHGYRVVEKLAKGREGLNLTYGVKDGIICHCGETITEEQSIKPVPKVKDLDAVRNRKGVLPATWEGCLVRVADKIAYIGRDIEDALLMGWIKIKDVPSIGPKVTMRNINGRIVERLFEDVIKNSDEESGICFSDRYFNAMCELYEFNMQNIYRHDNFVEYQEKIKEGMVIIFNYFLTMLDNELEKIFTNPKEFRLNKLEKAMSLYLTKMYKGVEEIKQEGNRIIVGDYIAGMTDKYFLKTLKELTIPDPLVIG